MNKCVPSPYREAMAGQSKDEVKAQFGETEFYWNFFQIHGWGGNYRWRNDSKTADHQSQHKHGWQLMKAEKLKHTAQPAGNSRSYRVSLPGISNFECLPDSLACLCPFSAFFHVWECLTEVLTVYLSLDNEGPSKFGQCQRLAEGNKPFKCCFFKLSSWMEHLHLEHPES